MRARVFREVVGEAGGAVVAVDGAAVVEAEAGGGVLHREIVGVGVEADVGDEGLAEVDASAQHAGVSAGGGKAVDCAIGVGVEPLAAMNGGVGWVGTDEECKGHRNFTVGVDSEIADSCVDVGADELARGIAVDPLAGVAGGAHKLPGSFVELH